MERTTVIIGAGLPLNLDIPKDENFPSTANITEQLCKPYPDYSKYSTKVLYQTDIVHKIREYWENRYPVLGGEKSTANFEQIFHCMEMYLSYCHSWENNCPNTSINPVFGPLTSPSVLLDKNELSSVAKQFIMRLMDIISKYDAYFKNEKAGNEVWLTDFFKGLPTPDIFNFNYDNMFENIYGEGNYVDGFESLANHNYKIFNPAKLLRNNCALPTVNHLHGCINYWHIDSFNDHLREVLFHDWVKYPDYQTVSKKMLGTTQSLPHTQTGDTIFNGPIITGLNKEAKLNCIPFDFYHANLVKSITDNPRLLIIGYGFGDLYCNQLIERMNLIHGDKARVCVIDYWDVESYESWLMHDFTYGKMNQDLGTTLCIYSSHTDFAAAAQEIGKDPVLYRYDSGQLMVGIRGFKEAAARKDEIIRFLKS
ncbi:MAG: SIR2 family protein [Muribaculaceae bacterium]|nr:SIR2 family protein [Muribaculaceae bacterium]